MGENDSVHLAYERISDNVSNKSIDFKNRLLANYLQFLFFRSKDKDCSPSDLIDMLWHSHILDTKGYISYCYHNFGKIVHHDPDNSLDQEKRQIRLNNTLNYFTKSNMKIDEEIWKTNEKPPQYIKLNQSFYAENNITITLKEHEGDTYNVDIDKRFTINELLQELTNNKTLSLTVDSYKIICGGKQLDRDDTLDNCDVKNGSVLWILKRLKGC